MIERTAFWSPHTYSAVPGRKVSRRAPSQLQEVEVDTRRAWSSITTSEPCGMQA